MEVICVMSTATSESAAQRVLDPMTTPLPPLVVVVAPPSSSSVVVVVPFRINCRPREIVSVGVTPLVIKEHDGLRQQFTPPNSLRCSR